MNLVAKEFVAARDDEDGVLVLSALAGAAQELRDALIINPYDVDGFADAIGARDRHAAERAARAHAGDAPHRRRPQRLRLGVGHSRGTREPVDEAAAVCGARARGGAGLDRRSSATDATPSSVPDPGRKSTFTSAIAQPDQTVLVLLQRVSGCRHLRFELTE